MRATTEQKEEEQMIIKLFASNYARSKEDKSTLWHIQVKEEMYWDNEMALQPCLCLSLLALYPNC